MIFVKIVCAGEDIAVRKATDIPAVDRRSYDWLLENETGNE